MNAVDVAKSYLGYYEKDKLSDIYTNKKGSKNFTKFAETYKNLTGENYQGQAWCAMFVSCCFAEAYGVKTAKEMLGGDFFAYTPTGASNFKNKNRYRKSVKEANVEDLVFFSNGGKRIDHVGIITYKGQTIFKTIEGNASNGVVERTYSYIDPRIVCVGITNATTKNNGWEFVGSQWKYRNDGEYLTNGFYYINGILFYFDSNGHMAEGQFFVDGIRYYAATSVKPITGAIVHITNNNDVKRVDKP
nr:MAG TPA: Putative amidase domain [Caudoviricetes sp.]